jgi:hypothetical protein
MTITVTEMISDVRSQLEELNTDAVTDDQIVGVLNRGQRKAANIVSRRADELMLYSYEFTTTDSSEYNIPSNAFARRIDSVEVEQGGIIHPIEISSMYKTTSVRSKTCTIPSYYVLKSSKIVLAPKPISGLTVRLWYSKTPDKYVQDYGYIINKSASSIIVNDVGLLSTTDIDYLNYFNVIDQYTGEIKCSIKVSSIDAVSKTVTLSESPSVIILGMTISPFSAVSSLISNYDYICPIGGTCTSQLPEAFIDYQIQFAILEFRRRFNEDVTAELQSLAEYEIELKKAWTGKKQKMVIQRRRTQWL